MPTTHHVEIHFIRYRPQRSWGKVTFSVACVKNSVHRGGGKYLDMYPHEQVPPWQVHPSGRYTPSPEQVHPSAGTPPGSSACWEIRATSGRYASYSNAFLFTHSSQILKLNVSFLHGNYRLLTFVILTCCTDMTRLLVSLFLNISIY